MKVTHVTLCDPSLWLYNPWNSPGQNTGAFPFSRRSSQPRDQTQVSCVTVRFFTSWATMEAHFLRKFHTITRSGCVNLHSHQLSKRLPFSPHLLQHLLFLDFFEWPFWYCKVIPHCSFCYISLIIHDLFMCLLAIGSSPLEKYLFKPSAHFFSWIAALFKIARITA